MLVCFSITVLALLAVSTAKVCIALTTDCASQVLTATGLANGNLQFSTPYRIDAPQTIINKFLTGYYASDPYGFAKFGAHPPMVDCWTNG